MLLAAGQAAVGAQGTPVLPRFGDLAAPISTPASGGGSSGVVSAASLVHVPTGLGSLMTPDGTCSAGRGGTCPHVQTNIKVYPSLICQQGATCPNGVPSQATVDLWANATGQMQLVYPPKVQVIFDVETTLFDGVYDPTAGDAGLSSCGGPCVESNAIPFFVSNAGTIAKDITGDFPGSNVTFARVDYFSTSNCAIGTCTPPCTTGNASTGDHDDGDGCQYHVDFSNFVDAVKFGKLVPPYFQNYTLSSGSGSGCTGAGWLYCDSDFSDNVLDSSSITSLYGALHGSGLQLDPNADLVIVWMGSTAPRDPNYVVDYTPFDADANTGTSATCEPSFYFPGPPAIYSPNCEGWVNPTTGNESIADLALSKHVIINTVVLDTGTTLIGGGDYLQPTSAAAISDVNHIVNAGCAMATATGGNWAGPVGFSCNGVPGYLSGGTIPAGQETSPPTAWSSNPLLGSALTSVRFPLGWTNTTASGTSGNAFQFVPAPGFAVASPAGYSLLDCYRSPSQPALPRSCNPNANTTGPALPNGGVWWSWADQRMYLNDSWGVSFHIVATPSLNSTALGTSITVDACQAQLFSGCGGPVSGQISAAEYIPYTNAPPPVSASFPPGMLTVYDSGPVVKVSASPTSVDVEPKVPSPGVYTTVLSASVVGGSGSDGYGWSGLPPGCFGADLPTISCTPTQMGSYNVVVAVTDNHGATGTAQYALVVHPDPVAVLTATPSAGPYPMLTVATANITGGLPPYASDLNWGDGFNDTLYVPAHHSYLLPGSYVLSLQVSDQVGGIATSKVRIDPVIPLSVGVRVLPNQNPYVDRNLAFNASILNNSGLWPYFYSWSGLPPGCVGGNFEEIDCSPSSPGPYTVVVHVQDYAGENASASVQVSLRALPSLIDVPVVGPVPADKLVADLVSMLVGFLVLLIAYFVLIAVYRYARERPEHDDEKPPSNSSGSTPPGPEAMPPPAAPVGELGAGGGTGGAGAPPSLDSPPALPGELPPAPPFVVPEGPAPSGTDEVAGPGTGAPSLEAPPLPSSDGPGPQ